MGDAVSLVPAGLGYLDALFAAIRSFARDLAAARAALSRAGDAKALSTKGATGAWASGGAASPWRFQTLAAARAALDAAGSSLQEVEERLRELGAPGDIPPPLDQLPKNLLVMRADLEAEEENFASLAREMASRPLGES